MLAGGPWTVLLVDDRAERRALMRMVLGTVPPPGRTAVVVTEAAGVAAAEREVLTGPVDAAVVEVQPVPVGLAAIEALRAASPSLVIVVCSFHLDPATQLQASLAGADAYLGKPVSRRDLLAACQASRR
ncbi:MAG: response regulator [Acidimicrobiales bacterium]